ncbi:MAG TPA: DinB family protein, partial [Ornithinibacter sp.]|nr:DinB family protein [Ornithinibacter sp.]
MATTSDLLLDLLSRVRENVHAVLESTPEDRLAQPPAEGANTVAWLVWHLTRVLDEQTAEVFGYPAVWEAGGWRERMALPLPADAH